MSVTLGVWTGGESEAGGADGVDADGGGTTQDAGSSRAGISAGAGEHQGETTRDRGTGHERDAHGPDSTVVHRVQVSNILYL